MLAGNVSKGLELTERQSLFFGVDASGRVEEGDGRRRRCSAAATRYYFRQSPRRVLFLNLSATAGANLDADQQILLGGDNGLRGYPLRYQSGEGRWLFTAEQRLFSNWYPFQLFNVGGAVFYDMGATWGQDPLGTPSQGVLRDVGFGLRFGNSRSALGNVLHVDVAYPLDGDASVTARAVPHRNEEELLMNFVRARLRPMIRVETVVLVVVAWLVATLNGAWWGAAGAGRDWSRTRELAVLSARFSWRWSRCTSCCSRRVESLDGAPAAHRDRHRQRRRPRISCAPTR